MPYIDHDQFAALTQPQDGPHLSLYMPTVKAGKEQRQNPTRFKNIVKRAGEELRAERVEETTASALLSRLETFGEDPEVWKRQERGLALFVTAEHLHSIAIPFPVEELVAVGPRFHLRPILDLLVRDRDFYVLLLGLGGCTLYRGNRFSLRPVEVPGMPANMDAALAYDDTDTTHKTGQRMPGRHGAQDTAQHGHATAEEKLNRHIDRYLRRVERSVSEHLNGSNIPLLLAGTEYLLPVYRRHNRYGPLREVEVTGTPNSFSTDSLRDAAWEQLVPEFGARSREAEQRFNSLQQAGRTARGVREVAVAAAQGRVETAFLRTDVPVWGSISDDATEAEPHERKQPGDVDLVDRAAVETLTRNGEIHLEPEGLAVDDTAAAILRY